MILAQSESTGEDERMRLISERITEHLRPILKKKSAHESSLILSCLKNHFIFYNLSQAELESVKEAMFYAMVDGGTTLFEKEDVGSCFFVVEKGSVEILVDAVVKKELKPGEGFGELALLYQHKRTSTVRAKSDCCFWVVDKVGFMEAVEEVVTREYEENRKYLESLKFFPFLESDKKDQVSASLVTLKYYKNQVIVEEGDPGSAFYIIKEGVAGLYKGTVEQRKMYRGESFGEMSLYYNTMRKMTVKAEDDVKCLVLGRETLAKIIGENFHNVMFRNFVRHSFQKNRSLSKLPQPLQDRLVESMKIAYYKPNDVVFKKGSLVHSLVVIFEGRLKKFKSPLTLAAAGETWGEEFLDRNRELKLDDDVITDADMVATEIAFEDVLSVLGGSLSEALGKVGQASMFAEAPPRSKAEFDKLSFKDFAYVGELCKIHYGSMHLVERREPPCQGRLIAKVIEKRLLKEQSLEGFLLNELQVLPMLSFPFISTFYGAAEEPGFHLTMFEYVNGMELYDVIRDIGLLSTRDCQFYVASMVLLLEYLQHKEVVLRDLKPENFVVDGRGYLKLVSFGASKWIGKGHKTATIIGTPHYMAPEMVEGKQYNEMVDLWAVGVMLYEFINGELPFGADTDNAYHIYEEILKGELSFPPTLKDKRARKLMEELLSPNPEFRHGGSYTNLRSNSWFETIDWVRSG